MTAPSILGMHWSMTAMERIREDQEDQRMSIASMLDAIRGTMTQAQYDDWHAGTPEDDDGWRKAVREMYDEVRKAWGIVHLQRAEHNVFVFYLLAQWTEEAAHVNEERGER